MKVKAEWDERFPDLFLSDDLDYWGKEIDLPEEDYKAWCDACEVIQDVENKVRVIESNL